MTTSKPQPIIPWMGGKRRLAKHLIPMFPEHTCYVELFAGGAALFFLRPEKAKVEVLNDINGELTNLYRVVQHHFDEFVKKFQWTLTARETFERLKKTPSHLLTDIQRAAQFFYLQSTCFGGKVTDRNFGYATTQKAFNTTTIAQKLKASQERLASAYVENDTWQHCLKRYDRPHTFFYADPPYWESTKYHTSFEWTEYEQLAKAMRTMQGKMMLSINDHPDVRALFAEFRITELQLTYVVGRNMESRIKRGELVICNW